MQIVVQKLNEEQLKDFGVYNWSIWTKEVSSFDWFYDSTEECYILEGEVEVHYGNSEKVCFSAGDFVTFPKGLACKWIISKSVRKHYRFL